MNFKVFVAEFAENLQKWAVDWDNSLVSFGNQAVRSAVKEWNACHFQWAFPPLTYIYDILRNVYRILQKNNENPRTSEPLNVDFVRGQPDKELANEQGSALYEYSKLSVATEEL